MYKVQTQNDSENYKFLCWKIERGIVDKKMPEVKEYTDRLEYELSVILEMGFIDYFLIIADILTTAEMMGIPRGPGRGSAAVSLVAFLTGITTIDPIRFGLFFERFLNPSRISMPDIDIDLCSERRAEVVKYIEEKYGSDRVANIIAFGKMKPRAAIKDVARALKLPNYVEHGDKVSKSIPAKYDDMEEALKKVELLQTEQLKHPEWIDGAMRVCGKPRHTSVHPAGLIVTPEAITNYIPLFYGAKSKTSKYASITQWDMYDMEETGFLKIDLLGLNTLTIMQRTMARIKERRGIDINIEDINLEDKEALQLFNEGQTTGIFQLERRYVQDFCRNMGIHNFMDVVVMNAIIRPGTMDSGMTDEFISRRKGDNAVEFMHPSLSECLAETYGILVYQEQAMQIAQAFAGFSLAEADNLRKAIGKKIPEKMAKAKETFVESAVTNMKRTKEEALDIFSYIETFARYGFNKSHAVSYGKITLQAAYLKAHYPTEFMCELLNGEMGASTDSKVGPYVDETLLMGIGVRKASILESQAAFTIVDDKTIDFGLAFIKNITEATSKLIIKARPKIKTLSDLLLYVSSKLNSKCVTSLINAGALDCINKDRDFLLYIHEVLAPVVKKYKDQQKRKKRGVKLRSEIDPAVISAKEQELLLAGPPSDMPRRPMEDIIEDEFLATNTYLTCSPLLPFDSVISAHTNTDIPDIVDGFAPRSKKKLIIAGMLDEIKEHIISKAGSKYNGRAMAFLSFSKSQKSLDCILFPDLYDTYKDKLRTEKVYLLKGEKGKDTSFTIDKMKLLSKVEEENNV